MNRLFVAYKPTGISSNAFLSKLKRKYGVKKAGFSGTLDPFAKGVLIIGFGSCTKLFRFLDKTPKKYRATLWLGCHSESLDTENVQRVERVQERSFDKVAEAVASLQGDITYMPPRFSAKKIKGKRAYDLARMGKEVELKRVKATIYKISLLHYCHPFVTFEASVSGGTYIRSLGEMIAKKLGTVGALSSLERLSEGMFVYENEKPLEIKNVLSIKQNFYDAQTEDLLYGKKLAIENMRYKDDGSYYIDGKNFISVITIKNGAVKYELGRIKC